MLAGGQSERRSLSDQNEMTFSRERSLWNFLTTAREVSPTMKEKNDARQLEKFKADLFFSYCHHGAKNDPSDSSMAVAQVDRLKTLRRNIYGASCDDV